MGVLAINVFTAEITNDTLTLTQSMGVKKVSIFNGSSTAGTVTGTRTLGGTTSSAINVAENETFTVESSEASVIASLVIVAPLGCTLKVVAQ